MKWLLYIGAAVVMIIVIVVIVGALLPKAHVATRSAGFTAPPQAIWDVITGPPDWHGKMDQVETVESVPPRRLVTRIADPTLPYGGSWTFEIAPDAAGTVLTITEKGEVYNPLFRFVSRFIMGHTTTMDAYLKALRVKLRERP